MGLNEQQAAAAAQFSRQSAHYGAGHILADTADLEAALGEVSWPAGTPALDVATGGGHTAKWLAGHGFAVTAADLSTAMLERTRELLAAADLPVRLRQHPAEDLPYPDGSFGVVTCRVAAHHFSDQARFVREVARVLRPGGWFLFIDGSVPDDEPAAAEWLHRVESLRDPSHGAFRGPKQWRGWCEEAGLRVLREWVTPMKQPDIEWYFATAGTSEENRREVRRLLREAPPRVREVFALAEEEGKWVWWWPRLTLVAER